MPGCNETGLYMVHGVYLLWTTVRRNGESKRKYLEGSIYLLNFEPHTKWADVEANHVDISHSVLLASSINTSQWEHNQSEGFTSD